MVAERRVLEWANEGYLLDCSGLLISLKLRLEACVRLDPVISKSIDLLWDAVVAVAAVVTHSASVPQTYPPRPQHAHSSPARIHSTTEPRLSTTLLSHCGLYLNVRPAFN